jgi:hypothetical protein
MKLVSAQVLTRVGSTNNVNKSRLVPSMWQRKMANLKGKQRISSYIKRLIELSGLPLQEFSNIVESIRVYAGVTPEQIEYCQSVAS